MQEKRNRDIKIGFWVTQEEKDIILRNMAEKKILYLSHYLRKVAIDTLFIDVNYKGIHELSNEVNSIGTNINQIAKRVNMTNNIYKDDIEEIKLAQKKIWEEIRKLYILE